MSATSFICEEDLFKKVKKIHKKTGKSQSRIINDALRHYFEKKEFDEAFKENKRLQHKILFILKELARYREDGDEFIQQIESQFEKYYERIEQKE